MCRSSSGARAGLHAPPASSLCRCVPGGTQPCPRTAAGGGLVLGHSDKEGGAVCELKHALDLALAKGGFCMGSRRAMDAERARFRGGFQSRGATAALTHCPHCFAGQQQPGRRS